MKIKTVDLKDIKKSSDDDFDDDDFGGSSSRKGRDIYFTGKVSDSSVQSLTQNLRAACKDELVWAIREETEPRPIRLRVNSYGGVLTAGMAAGDIIREINQKLPVHTYVEGTSASAATFITASGRKRFMTSSSQILIHQLSWSVWGTFSQIEDTYESSLKMMDKMKRFYASHTYLTDEFIEALLKRDLYLTAEEALEYGLVDEIL